MTRVNYIERQRLRAKDLRSEQEYLLGLAGRHYIGPHTWGIVSGLSISFQNDKAVVGAGLAIDGYGRELVVSRIVELPLLPDVTQQFVYLYYCERPQGNCGDRPNTRWRDVAELIVSDRVLLHPEDNRELSITRSAGSIEGYPPWPILLGLTVNTVPATKDEELEFAALRTARVVSPSARAVLRIGQETLADPYQARVLAQDEKGALQDRFAVDRDGNTSIWGNLILSGAKRSRAIPSHIEGIYLKAEIKAGNGAEVRSKAELTTKMGIQLLELTFRSKTRPGQVLEDKLVLDTTKSSVKYLEELLAEFSKTSVVVRLTATGKSRVPEPPPVSETDTSQPPPPITASAPVLPETTQPTIPLPRDVPIAAPAAPPAPALPEPVFVTALATARSPRELPPELLRIDDREFPFEYEGGILRFEPEATEKAPAFCGCREPGEELVGLPEGFVFKPGSQVPAGSFRDIHCLRWVREDQVAVEELRVLGGAKKEGDLRRHISIGDSTEKDGLYVFRPWLFVRGNGAVEMPVKAKDPNGKFFPMLRATGTIELPPIAPDPRDPIFNFLSISAFIKGVMSMGAALLKVSFPLPPPPFIEPTQPWSYKLTLENLSPSDAMESATNTEVITADNGLVKPLSIPNLPKKLEAKPSALHIQTIDVLHQGEDIPTGAGDIELRVTVIMTAGKLAVGAEATSPYRIPVRPSPSLDLSELTEEIEQGSSFDIHIVNEADTTFSVISLEITGLGAEQNPMPGNTVIGPGTSESISVNVNGDEGLTTVEVILFYLWHDTNAMRALRQKKDVTIEEP